MASIEQSQGVYNWTNLDLAVSTAEAHGVMPYYCNLFVPPWAAADPSTCSVRYSIPSCSSTVSNMQYFDDFITQLATRYKGKMIYEIWNEPDHGVNFTGTIAQMVDLATHMYNIIRSIDPGDLIVNPSYTHSANLDAYFAAGGPRGVDIICIHGYPDVAQNDVPEGVGGFKTVPFRTVMLKYGLTQPMWDTEASWGQEPPAITDPDLRAAFIARHYILHWSNALFRYYWFEWDATNYGTLWSPISGISKAGIALGTVENWVIGATMPNACSINGGTLYHAVYTCDFIQSSGAHLRVVWNTDGDSIYVAPSQYTHYQDLYENTYNIPSNHNVTIGHQPILLQP